MSLAEIPNDLFTEDEHQSMDENLAYISHKPSNDEDYAILLFAVVGSSNGRLKYFKLVEADRLIKETFGLRDQLRSAWEKRSYRPIRILKVLQLPARSLNIRPLGESEIAGLRAAMTADLKGASVKGLHEYLQINNYKYSTTKGPGYYGRFCSIVQSSGTGKTRLMLELVNLEVDVLVLYMNLRADADSTGFPLRDDFPATLLTEGAMNERTYTLRCRLFFAGVFHIVTNYLKNGITKEWRKALCKDPPIRADFFKNLKATYYEIKNEIAPDEVNITDDNLTTAAHLMMKCYEDMTSLFSYGPSGVDMNEPKLVIALDEAHWLHESTEEFHRASILLQTIREYSDHHPVWVIFTSTTSRVSHFAPPQVDFPSARVRIDGHLLFEPFCQTGWDVYAPDYETVRYTEVAKTKNLIGYGRPLWHSRVGALPLQEIFQLAREKLRGNPHINPGDATQALAVLGQRFGLEVSFGHHDAVEFIESAVESHLRVCIATTDDHVWTYTTYPSEPFLSCAAASLLHEDNLSLDTSLKVLRTKIENGMIEVGERGELVSRLLWLIAKDIFVLRDRTDNSCIEGPVDLDSELTHCQMISVVDFLQFVFGDQFWSLEGCEGAREQFQDAYVNFSHWVSMNANIRQMEDGEPKPFQASLEEFTMRHWKRTSAVQCCHDQPLVDKMIPICFKSTGHVSQIFISDTDRVEMSEDALHNVRNNASIGGPDSSNSPAYIVILGDLSVAWNPGLSVTFPSREPLPRSGADHEAACLRIQANGMHPDTFPCLTNHHMVFKTLHGLVERHFIPTRKRKYSQFLQGQVQFSSSAELRHLKWEDWSETNPEDIIRRYGMMPAEAVDTNLNPSGNL